MDTRLHARFVAAAVSCCTATLLMPLAGCKTPPAKNPFEARQADPSSDETAVASTKKNRGPKATDPDTPADLSTVTEELAQQVKSTAQSTAAGVRQVAAQATNQAEQSEQQMDELVTSIKQADLPDVARQQAMTSLEKLSTNADEAVRVRAAQAMGQVADTAVVPTLVAMLNDVADVQNAAMESLTVIAGADEAASEDGKSLSQPERVRRWQLWYQSRPQQTATRQPPTQR